MKSRVGTVPDFARERGLIGRGLWPVAGVDEVGRGPLAGPVVAAAVILDPDRLPLGVADSKQLTAHERESAFALILEAALAVSVAAVPAGVIDRIDIRQASLLAMRRAVAGLALPPAYALVDGRDPPALPCPVEAIVRGDAAILSIAAASVVAKVARDRTMTRLDAVHPAYGFARHMGYATRAHREAIAAHGPCPLHRMSFRPLAGP